MRTFTILVLFTMLGVLVPGCATPQRTAAPGPTVSPTETRVDFTDPVLNSRKILLFGPIDQQAGEITIQKLLFLDGRGHDPIDLFLETPGGDMKYGWAIRQTMGLIHSPVNTYALSECNSAGALLLAAGTGKRRAFHDSVIVIHGLKPGVGDDKPPVDFVTDFQKNYTEFWRERAKLPQDWLPLPFDSLRILTSEQALEYGIIDEVVGK